MTIEAIDLSLRYGDHLAVDRVSFTVAAGEIVGLLGPNGAGKTTTLRMLAGFLRPSSGRARIAELDLATDALAARARLGYLPELAPLYEEMRVEELLGFRARLKGVPASDVARVASQAGIDDLGRRLCGQLSRGQRQRVGLADALLGSPRALILDEPATGLDPNQMAELRQLLSDQAKSSAVLLSTHALAEAEALSTRVVILARGRVVADAPPARLVSEHGSLAAAFARLTRVSASSEGDDRGG